MPMGLTPEPSTPLMRQYQAAKKQVPGALLLFRLGDFYELFFDDAVTASRELEITLTSRNKEKGEPIPMCGVPYHAAEGYIARLIQKGFRVAICEQMEEAGPGKKLVRREVTRIITPGTATDSNLLHSHENNYLAAVLAKGNRSGLAYVDISTGEFQSTELDSTDLIPTLETLNVREVIHPLPAAHRARRASKLRSIPGSSARISPRARSWTISTFSLWMASASVTARWPPPPAEPFCITFAIRSAPPSGIFGHLSILSARARWSSTPPPSATSSSPIRYLPARAANPRCST